MKTAACKGSGLMTPLGRARVIRGEETRKAFDFDFHEGLCEFDTEFAWRVFLLA